MKFHVFGFDGAPNRLFALHGFMARGEAWESFAEELGADWQVIYRRKRLCYVRYLAQKDV